MLLYFLRHGDASSNSQFHDSERPLTEVGKKQAFSAGKFLQHNKTHINFILTSPLTRACETGKIVQSIIDAPRIDTTEYLLNGTPPQQLFQWIEKFDVESFLLVGHEPFLSTAISLLISGGQKADIEMKKCSLAIVESPASLQLGSGVLKQLIHNDTLSKFNNL
jgi:phosphohistidine phosphatase